MTEAELKFTLINNAILGAVSVVLILGLLYLGCGAWSALGGIPLVGLTYLKGGG